MNKKVLLVSLGIITLGWVIFLSSGSLLWLKSDVLNNTVTAVNKRYFISEDGKNMYTLTFNQDGSRKYSMEIPTEYTDTYTDEYGVHEQPIAWPFTDFPREAVDSASLSTDYYLSSAITKWANWYKKEYTQYFEAELTALLPARDPSNHPQKGLTKANKDLDDQNKKVASCPEASNSKTYPAGPLGIALQAANDLLAAHTAAKVLLQTKLDTLTQLQNGDPQSTTEEGRKGVARREAELVYERDSTVILPEFPANIIPLSVRQAALTSKITWIYPTLNTVKKIDDKLKENSITVKKNTETNIPKQQKIIYDNTQKLSAGNLTQANRSKYTTTKTNAEKEMARLLQENNTLVGGGWTAVGSFSVRGVSLEESDYGKLTRKKHYLEERDKTIPARKSEIDGLVGVQGSSKKWTLWKTYNDLSAEIQRLPIKTLTGPGSFEEKIKQDNEAIRIATVNCKVETDKIPNLKTQVAYNQKIVTNTLDKLAKMGAAKRGNTPLCSLINGQILLEDEYGDTTLEGKKVSLGQSDPKRFRLNISYTGAQVTMNTDFYINDTKVPCPSITENMAQEESTGTSTTPQYSIPECSDIVTEMQTNNPWIQFTCTGQYAFAIEGNLIRETDSNSTGQPHETTLTSNYPTTLLNHALHLIPITFAEGEICSNGASNYPTCNDNQTQYCTNKSNNFPDCNNVCENNATNPPECDDDVSKMCGDWIKWDDEQCDDGNSQDGDGCSGSCTVEEENCTDGTTNFLGSNIFWGSQKVCNLGCKFDRDGVTNFDPKADKDDGSCKCDNGLDFYDTLNKHINSCQCDLKYLPGEGKEYGTCVKASCKNGLDSKKYPLCECPGMRDTIVNGECKTYSGGRTLLVWTLNLVLNRFSFWAIHFDDAGRMRIPVIH